jgi:hypothetical protein
MPERREGTARAGRGRALPSSQSWIDRSGARIRRPHSTAEGPRRRRWEAGAEASARARTTGLPPDSRCRSRRGSRRQHPRRPAGGRPGHASWPAKAQSSGLSDGDTGLHHPNLQPGRWKSPEVQKNPQRSNALGGFFWSGHWRAVRIVVITAPVVAARIALLVRSCAPSRSDQAPAQWACDWRRRVSSAPELACRTWA